MLQVGEQFLYVAEAGVEDFVFAGLDFGGFDVAVEDVAVNRPPHRLTIENAARSRRVPLGWCVLDQQLREYPIPHGWVDPRRREESRHGHHHDERKANGRKVKTPFGSEIQEWKKARSRRQRNEEEQAPEGSQGRSLTQINAGAGKPGEHD